MVAEYDEQYYSPAQPLVARLAGPSPEPVRRLAAWLERVEPAWSGVLVEQLSSDATRVRIGTPLRVEAMISLNGLRPADVAADLLYGRVDEHGDLIAPWSTRLRAVGPVRGGRARYRSEPIALDGSGAYGLLVRLTPNHADLLPSQAQARARWGP
jgi:starch phosphorylase